MDETSAAIGRLQATVEGHDADLKELRTVTGSINTKLDTLLARGDQRKATIKAGVTGITIVAAIIEGAHQIADFFHRGH